MEDWQETEVETNLSKLLQYTRCNSQLYAKLRRIFSIDDIDEVKAERTPQKKASKLYEIAVQKTGGYEAVAVALMEAKQTGALKILLEGYNKNEKSIPKSLQLFEFCDKESRRQTCLVNGTEYTWEQLLGKNAPEQRYKEIEERFKNCADRSIRLLREEVSPKKTPAYYISRTFISKTELDHGIFKDYTTTEHVFVVKGVSEKILRRIIGSEMIDISTNQLEKISTRFIILKNEEDFDKICKISTAPVHMIIFKKGRFFWVKSTKEMDLIQRFMNKGSSPLKRNHFDDSSDSEDGKHDDVSSETDQRFYTFGETEAVQRITSLQPLSSAITIAESPGMGKTIVLASLAEKIGESDPKAVTIFIVLRELVNQTYLTSSSSTHLDHIFRYATEDHLRQSILKEIWRNNTFKFYLLFDGYDEVFPENLDFVDSMLQQLLKTENIKMIITTRKHLQPRLENLLNSISLEMIPFTPSNQINFLTKYWTTQHGAEDGKHLRKFAKKCLNKLKPLVTDIKENTAIDGLPIPLQCMVLAEVHIDDSILASNEQLPEDFEIKEFSHSLMYKILIEKKLRKIHDPMTRQKYLDAHIYESICLLFPNMLYKFKPFLIQRDQIDENTLYSIGLLEKVFRSPSFVHRTLGEYLLTDFVIRNIKKSYIFVDFFFKQVLGDVYPMGRQGQPTFYNLKHPVIAYFLSMNLPESLRNEDYSTLDIENIKEEHICIAANLCCINNLERCFDLTSIIMKRFNVKDNEELKDKYIRNLLHLVLENKNNTAEFIEKVRKFLKQEFGLNLSDLVFPGYYRINDSLQLPNCTPLHLALCWRRYDIVKLWLKECGKDIRSIKHLLHFIVVGSTLNSEPGIEEELPIIETLIHQDKDWLEEEIEGRKPLLQEKIHPKIAKQLVDLGANINTYSSKFGTVLHTAGDENSISDVVQWAFKNGFNLVNQTNERGLTPLMVVIWKCSKIVDYEILQLFSKAGADFNAQDCEGDSVLFYAIKYSSSPHLLQKLLEYGANPNHQNKWGRNAAHIVLLGHCGFTRFRLDQALGKLQILKQNGFDGLNQIDNNGWTPLMLAVENSFFWVKDDLQQLLDEKDFDFNAQDNDGNSVLFYAMKPYANLDFIEKLLNCGADPNHRNRKNENAAHWIILQFDSYQNNLYLALEILKLLQRKGFNGLDQKDLNGDTPLKLAMNKNIDDSEFLDFLRKRTSE